MNRELLSEYIALKSEKAQLQELLSEIDAQRSSPGQLPEPITVRADEVRHLYENKSKALNRKLIEIESAIDSLPSTERQILRLRYIQGKKWDDVADAMGYCRQQARRIHNKALRRLGQKSPQ